MAWLFFFTFCIGSWVLLYGWSTGMNVDLLGMPRMEAMGQMSGMTAEPAPMGDMATGQMQGGEMSGGMAGGGMEMSGGMTMDGMGGMNMSGMDMDMDGMMAMDRFTPLVLMWAAMMAAMMLPTFVPTARVFTDLIEAQIARPVGLLGLTIGYSAVWIGMAALLALAQLTLISLGLVGAMGQSLSPWFSAGLLIVAGAYQFTALKDRCAAHCRSPMSHFLATFRPGLRGGVRLGLVTGAYCAGCCWGLMAIGFAGGMMSLLWMGLATVLMTLEKLPQVGRWLTTPIGVGLIGLGLWVAVRALTG